MTSQPKLSVIVATCKRVPMVLDAIRSVLESTYQNFELIVVDQDEDRVLERELASRFQGEQRISYHFQEAKILSRARNAGMAVATGDVFVFLDDDAAFAPTALSAYAAIFANYTPTPGAVAGKLIPAWESPQPRWLPEEKRHLLGIYDRTDAGPMHRELPVGANFAVSREAALAAGSFNEELGFSYNRRGRVAGEDSVFSIVLLRLGFELLYEPAAAAYHRIGTGKAHFGAFSGRNYWEGVTQVCIHYCAGDISRASAAGIVYNQLKAVAFAFFKIFVRRTPSDSRIPDAGRLARNWFELCSAIGSMRAALKLWKHGVLP